MKTVKIESTQLINFRKLSMFLAGNTESIRTNNIPQKYKPAVDELTGMVGKWIEKQSDKSWGVSEGNIVGHIAGYQVAEPTVMGEKSGHINVPNVVGYNSQMNNVTGCESTALGYTHEPLKSICGEIITIPEHPLKNVVGKDNLSNGNYSSGFTKDTKDNGQYSSGF